MQQQIFDMLMQQEEVSWKSIIYDLVKTEQMDPWDINITLLTHKYIDVIKAMPEHDLKVSGKIILAAAVLLKLKSTHLIENDLSKLDSMMNPHEDLEEIEEELFQELEGRNRKKMDQYTLIPRNPQPRNRKVSVHDLVNALQRAMISKKRILAKIRPEKFTLPDKNMDITEVIHDIYQKITYYAEKDKKEVTFTRLLPPRAGKTEKVYTFIPLLHLENHHKIEMKQEAPFEEIHVEILKKRKK